LYEWLWSVAIVSGTSPPPLLPPMPEDEEEVLEAGPSADKSKADGATMGRGWWPRPPRLEPRSLEKRGDHTGQDGNLQSYQQGSTNGPQKESPKQKEREKKKKRKTKHQKNYPQR
jgi:hypothetical protein